MPHFRTNPFASDILILFADDIYSLQKGEVVKVPGLEVRADFNEFIKERYDDALQGCPYAGPETFQG